MKRVIIMSKVKLEMLKLLDEMDFFLRTNDEKNVKKKGGKKNEL